jgi:hypothetical protein
MTIAGTLRQQIDGLLDTLSIEDQRRVLQFIQAIQGNPPSITGKDLVEWMKQIPEETREAAKEAYEVWRREHELESRMLERTGEIRDRGD